MKQLQQFQLTHPITGKSYAIDTPENTFHPDCLVKAMELVKSGRDPQAVIKLIRPYRDRPEILNMAFKVMFAMGGINESNKSC